MIRSVLDTPKEKLDLLQTAQLTSFERDSLADLCQVLTPFEEATVYLQPENTVSASYVLPCIRGLSCKLKKLSSTRLNGRLVQALSASLEKRLGYVESETVFTVASALDPRFKTRWCMSSREKSDIRIKMTHLAETVVPLATTDCVQSPARKRVRTGEDLFDFMEDPEADKLDPDTSVSQEVMEYLGESCLGRDQDPLAYWSTNERRFPHLAAMAQKYLALQASSAPVERLFSVAGKVFRPERCLLKDSTFEKLMFVRCNSK